MRHQFTTAERQKGFRNAVFSIQVRYNLDFNQAVQWLLRRGKGLRWSSSPTSPPDGSSPC